MLGDPALEQAAEGWNVLMREVMVGGKGWGRRGRPGALGGRQPNPPPHSPQAEELRACQHRAWEPTWPGNFLCWHSCGLSQEMSDSVLKNWLEWAKAPCTSQAVSTHPVAESKSLVDDIPLGRTPVPQH